MISLYTCDQCKHSLTTDYALHEPVGCPWCHGEVRLRQLTSHVDPVAIAKQFPPGTSVRHRLTEQVLMVLELEGDGSTGWFTARDKNMATHRIRYVEVESMPGGAPPKLPDGQYL